MKNREEIEKEFDDFFPELLGENYPINDGNLYTAMDKMSLVLKSHISKIRQDDIDGLVEWAIGMFEAQRELGSEFMTPRDYRTLSRNQTLSDIIAHLHELKKHI